MGCASSSHVVPGGFAIGDHVYYRGAGVALEEGSSLVFGQSGEVVGQTCAGDVVVSFIAQGRRSVRPSELTRMQPSIPGDFKLGERVFYGGPARKYPNGDHLVFSAQGEVTGRSCVGDGMDGERLAVNFPKHRDAKAVRIALLSRQPPQVPGGYQVGDRVYWCGMNWTFPNGDKLKFAAEGEVAGRSCVGDGLDDERVAVNFPGNKGAVAMRLPEISHEFPVIPGGYSIGDRVYYAFPNWRAPDGHMLLFGVMGKVIGRSCIGDGKDDERVWVLFPGLGYGCICLDQISREAPVIPGSYALGDVVYFQGAARSTGQGADRVTFGARGEVTGCATSSRSGGRADVAVMFPGNEDATDVRLAEICREVPVLPNNLQLDSYVWYTGQEGCCSRGGRLTYGARGILAGKSSQGDEEDQYKVALFLPGNRSAVNVYLSDIVLEPPGDLVDRLKARLAEAEAALTSEAALPPPTASPFFPSPGSPKDSPKGLRELTPICRIAVCREVALGADLAQVIEYAEAVCFDQVSRALARKDLAVLSELRRAAEDTEWKELDDCVGMALEEVTLPQVLKTAEDEGDAFALVAVQRRARSKGFTHIENMATELIRKAEVSDSMLRALESEETATLSEDNSPELLERMQRLLDETYTGWGGFGKRTRTRDRPNEKVPDNLHVESVQQLRNLDSYLSYLARRQVIGAELPEDARRDWKVRTDSSSGSLSPQTRRAGEDVGGSSTTRSVLSLANPRLNEHYLWHGTGPAEAKGIAAKGFDISQAGSSRGALFGKGLYFAESCLKADEYVRPDEEKRYPLILCRVVLGNVNYCDAEDPWELRESLRISCRQGLGGHHSVLGDREKVRQTFREFVVFDGHQAYPEYIVWYTRD